MLRVVKTFLIMVLVCGVTAGAFSSGYIAGATGTTASPLAQVQRAIQPGTFTDPPRQFKLLDEVWSILNTDFVDKTALDADKLGQGAVDGLLRALGDVHTSFIDVEDYQAEQSGIRGSYEGIGASVAMVEGILTIIAPLPGSPAEQSGIRAGDRILEIDGSRTDGLNLTDAVNKVKGPRGSKVALLVQHQEDATPILLQVTRAEIRTSSVVSRMLPDNLAHIRITQFAQRTSTEVREAINNAKSAGAKGIVLDLRNNPGGLLDTTVEVTSDFLSGGVAGYQVDRQGNKAELRLPGNGQALDVPVVVLVNQGSASGSELLAGALQDRNRALLIGTRTFGKGSVNHLRELTDGSALYVTIGRWLTPNGRQIEGNGLQPDVNIAFTEADAQALRDPQMEYAVKALLAQIQGLPRPEPPPAPTVTPTAGTGNPPIPQTNP